MMYEYTDEWGYTYTAEITSEVRDMIVSQTLALFPRIGFCGETIIQCDEVYELAPILLAQLADNIGFIVKTP